MDPRYENKEIKNVWRTENKLLLWQRTEIAVLEAMASMLKIPKEAAKEMQAALLENPIDVEWWKKRDGEIHHDLNAFIDERLRFLKPEHHQYFHKKITSYDTEEPAFATMLIESIKVVMDSMDRFHEALEWSAVKYRYTIMNGRTHGQEAEMQTFGKRCLCWIQDFRMDMIRLERAIENLRYSKISGAIGNYGSISPELEERALKCLNFKPFYGATQIMPRELYAPIAQALAQTVSTLNKIALAIRLGARSGRPLFHEPFSKKQKGSSAMPHKKNTIITEQVEGMERMAHGYLLMIMRNIATWEERAIEQSCVERVAWPDLFHVTAHSLDRMTKVIEGLVVYPDNMLREIVESKGCYASSEAKEFLKEEGAKHGLSHEDAYRIVQLAAFNVFEPIGHDKGFRMILAGSIKDADDYLRKIQFQARPKDESIRDIISRSKIYAMPDLLEADDKKVEEWCAVLEEIFKDPDALNRWNNLFQPSHLLKNEDVLYKEILGV